jgi:hypothetical protein
VEESVALVYGPVKIVCDDLTDAELVALSVPVMLGVSPKQCRGYGKARSLFTEQKETRMHEVTRTVFLSIASERLGLAFVDREAT